MKGKKADVKICKISDGKQLRFMSVDSQFSCAKCGAKSHDSLYLCQPETFLGR